MFFKNTTGEIVTTALLSLVLSLGIIVMTLQALGASEHKDADNTKLLETFASAIESISEQSFGEFDYFVDLNDEDLFLFFSQGTDPIFLEYTGQDYTKHYYVFGRPSVKECEDRACICHCTGGPFWLKDKTETVPIRLVPINLFKDYSNQYSGSGGFLCQPMECIGDPLPPQTSFGNSRGVDAAYYDAILDSVARANDKNKETYYGIPLDIVILIQTADAKSHDLLFSTRAGKDYNHEEQQTAYVDLLVNDYVWDGGVVIGGMGYVPGRFDIKKDLEAPKVEFRFEKKAGLDNIIGVCIHDACLYDGAKDKLLALHKVGLARQDVQNLFVNLKNEVEVLFSRCRDSGKPLASCYSDLHINGFEPFFDANVPGIQILSKELIFSINHASTTTIVPEITYTAAGKTTTITGQRIQAPFLYPYVNQSGVVARLLNNTKIIMASDEKVQLSGYAGTYILDVYKVKGQQNTYAPIFEPLRP